jgi:hypothetical protein
MVICWGLSMGKIGLVSLWWRFFVPVGSQSAADTANIRNLSLISLIQRRIIAQTIAQTPDDFLPQMRTSNRYLAYICIKKPESPRNVTMGRYLDRTSA